jgi:nicotinamidase-related amidase
MRKLTANDPETKSTDLVAENIARLTALFPELVTEGPDGAAVNVDVLKALVGEKTVTDVFRDSAFADDVAKTNLAAILEQHGITNVRSL